LVKEANKMIIVLINCTWGVIQNFLGAIVYAICVTAKGHPSYPYKGAIVTYVKGFGGGISLGSFIFIGTNVTMEDAPKSFLVNHEYGHSLQSAILGPLYLLVIGLPSIIWANFFGDWRKRNNKNYYWFYPERWANRLGGVKS
jgi:hypothetical protein